MAAERVLQFAAASAISSPSEASLLVGLPSLQPLQVVKALARMIEQVQKPLVQQMLFEEDEKGQHGQRRPWSSQSGRDADKAGRGSEQRPYP